MFNYNHNDNFDVPLQFVFILILIWLWDPFDYKFLCYQVVLHDCNAQVRLQLLILCKQLKLQSTIMKTNNYQLNHFK